MMLLHLVKKDFLIAKEYVLLMAVVSIVIPLFMLWRVPALYAGSMGFILSAVFAVLMLLQYVLLKEYQSPKAESLLCLTPYPRKLLVLSKYCFCLAVFAACCILFWAEALIFPNLGGFHWKMGILTFFALSIFVSIYLPIQYKLSYEKTRFIFAVFIMASPFLLPLLLKMGGGVRVEFLEEIPPLALYGGIFLAGLVFPAISARISIAIYQNADLP